MVTLRLVILPSIAQIEYRIGKNHLCAPPLYAHRSTTLRLEFLLSVTFNMRVPGWLVKPILTPVALRIFRQDAEVLKLQTEAIRRFGEERFTSTELDLLGAQILRLMRRAEPGTNTEDERAYRKRDTPTRLAPGINPG